MKNTSVTEAIYDAGFNSSGRFYEKSKELLGMTPTQYRAGGLNKEIRFAVGESSLGAILVASSVAVVRHPSWTTAPPPAILASKARPVTAMTDSKFRTPLTSPRRRSTPSLLSSAGRVPTQLYGKLVLTRVKCFWEVACSASPRAAVD